MEKSAKIASCRTSVLVWSNIAGAAEVEAFRGCSSPPSGKSGGSRHPLPSPFLETEGSVLDSSPSLPSLSPACSLHGNLIFIESHTPPRAHVAPRTPICDRVAVNGRDLQQIRCCWSRSVKATNFLYRENVSHRGRMEPGKAQQLLRAVETDRASKFPFSVDADRAGVEHTPCHNIDLHLCASSSCTIRQGACRSTTPERSRAPSVPWPWPNHQRRRAGRAGRRQAASSNHPTPATACIRCVA
jgi:hypothetical protein